MNRLEHEIKTLKKIKFPSISEAERLEVMKTEKAKIDRTILTPRIANTHLHKGKK